MLPDPLAEEFLAADRGRKRVLVHPDLETTLSAALLEGTGCEPVDSAGRGQLQRLRCGGRNVLIRTYRRGGALRHILPTGFWFVNRPLNEFRVHRAAEEAGVAVPSLLGISWERSGAVYRGRIATEELEDSDHLLDYVIREGDGARPVLETCGRVIRDAHDAGIFHGDLQIRNILVKDEEACLIDFDKARLGPPLGRTARSRNLLRLSRSMAKNGLPARYFEWLSEGYGATPFPPWLSCAYRVRGAVSDWLSQRRPLEGSRGLSDAAALAAVAARGEVLKESSKSLTKRVGSWVVKMDKMPSVFTFPRVAFGGARHLAGWNAARHLSRNGIAVPQPLALVQIRVLGLGVGHAVVSDYLEGCVNVEEHARGLVRDGADTETILEFLIGLGESVNALCNSGAYHSDLSGKNILTPDGKTFYFIDLDAVLLDGNYDDGRRMKNHIQLYDSFCDLWDEDLLGPFVKRMCVEGQRMDEWLGRVRSGQRERRERQRRIWDRQEKTS